MTSFKVHSFGVRDQRSGIRDQGSGIRDQGSEIRDQRSGIRDQGSGITDHGSAKDPNIEFLVSHPFAGKKANGWGTGLGCEGSGSFG
jgi:hypothetical protein